MTDKDIETICEKIDSLHAKILKSKFAEVVTESEILSLILAVQELNRQKTEIEEQDQAIIKALKHMGGNPFRSNHRVCGEVEEKT